MIVDPGHGKYKVDSINSCDKRYLIGKVYAWYPRSRR